MISVQKKKKKKSPSKCSKGFWSIKTFKRKKKEDIAIEEEQNCRKRTQDSIKNKQNDGEMFIDIEHTENCINKKVNCVIFSVFFFSCLCHEEIYAKNTHVIGSAQQLSSKALFFYEMFI